MAEEKAPMPVSIDPQQEAAFKQMLEAGVFYGKRKSKTHPKMKPYVLHNRNGIEVINVQKTQESLDRALAFLRSRVSAGAQMIVVGTQPTLADLVASFAAEFNLSSVSNRWLGGTITNYAIIGKRIEHLKKLKRDLAAGAFDKYTKKERVMIEKEIKRLQELLGGVEFMTKLPDLMLVIDPKVHDAAVREAHHAKIPVIALTNVDTNPDFVEYPVVANTNGVASVTWFLNNVREVLKTSAVNTKPVENAVTTN